MLNQTAEVGRLGKGSLTKIRPRNDTATKTLKDTFKTAGEMKAVDSEKLMLGREMPLIQLSRRNWQKGKEAATEGLGSKHYARCEQYARGKYNTLTESDRQVIDSDDDSALRYRQKALRDFKSSFSEGETKGIQLYLPGYVYYDYCPSCG